MLHGGLSSVLSLVGQALVLQPQSHQQAVPAVALGQVCVDRLSERACRGGHPCDSLSFLSHERSREEALRIVAEVRKGGMS